MDCPVGIVLHPFRSNLRGGLVGLACGVLLGACAQGRPPDTASPKREETTTIRASRPPKPNEALQVEAPPVPPPVVAAAPPRPAAALPARAQERRAQASKPRALDDLLSDALAGPEGKQGVGGLSMRGYGGGGMGRAAPALRMQRSPALAGGPARPLYAPLAHPAFDTEAYAHRRDHRFLKVADSPLSTFSIDVDTASYGNVRRFLRDGMRPPADAVRIEELVNYFRYDYPEPQGDSPLGVYSEVASAPWNPEHKLVQVGLRAKDMHETEVPPRNLVFLIDVSGSMMDEDKLPLLKRGLSLLAARLRAEDRLAIVVYAGASGLALPSTPGHERGRILATIDALEAGGSTNGAQGIELAYRTAQQHFVKGGINRVILATDGDFNVGVTSEGELTRLIEDKRKTGVFLTVLGFGTGNVKDATMEMLADKGNGNYAYVDSLREAHKVLVREAGSTLVTVAKDVKLQIEWNPRLVASYRLIGYENRVLAARDFNDDEKDAGEVGAGHTVTALYEIQLTGRGRGEAEVDPLRYQQPNALSAQASSDELLTLKLRHKLPDSDQSRLAVFAVKDRGQALGQTSPSFRWAAAVTAFGMLLRASEDRGKSNWSLVRSLAQGALGRDESGDRAELLELIKRAEALGIGS